MSQQLSNNQFNPQPEVIISTHFNAARQEILEKVKMRDTYIRWFVYSSAVLLGLYFQKDRVIEVDMLLAIPILGAITAFIYLNVDQHIMKISEWMFEGHKQNIEEYSKQIGFKKAIGCWDYSKQNKDFVTNESFKPRYFSVIGLISGASALTGILMCKEIVFASGWELSYQIVQYIIIPFGFSVFSFIVIYKGMKARQDLVSKY